MMLTACSAAIWFLWWNAPVTVNAGQMVKVVDADPVFEFECMTTPSAPANSNQKKGTRNTPSASAGSAW